MKSINDWAYDVLHPEEVEIREAALVVFRGELYEVDEVSHGIATIHKANAKYKNSTPFDVGVDEVEIATARNIVNANP